MDNLKPDVADLIQRNGNHWRKILTIMAKLTVTNGNDWRVHRDHSLFEQLAVVFDIASLEKVKPLSEHTLVFIVGRKLRAELPIAEESTKLNYECWWHRNYIWCPYLDYRQFPNALIAELKGYVLEK
ncbi:hypothetical protein THO17_04020 [Marinomonas sp. THO17]